MKRIKKDIDGIFDEIKDERIELSDSTKNTIARLEKKEAKTKREVKERKPIGRGFMGWLSANRAIATTLASVMIIIAVLVPVLNFWGRIDLPDVPGGGGGNTIYPPATIKPIATKSGNTKESIISAIIESQIITDEQGNIVFDGENTYEEYWDIADGMNPDNPPNPPEEGEAGGDKGDYAETNVQVEGVDEGDIIKVDDAFIYTLSQAGLTIASVENGLKIASQKHYDNFVPVEMYILGDKLIVIGGIYKEFVYDNPSDEYYYEPINYSYMRYEKTRVIIYGLSQDRTSLSEINNCDFSGVFLTSRLTDGTLFLAVNHAVNYNDEDTYSPAVDDEEINPGCIFVHDNIKRNYVVMATIKLETGDINFAAHLGLYGIMTGITTMHDYIYAYFYGSYQNTIYVSKEYIYFINSWQGGVINDMKDGTQISKISLKYLTLTAQGEVSGTVSDRYYADEYDGNLRLVTWTSGWFSNENRHTNVFILNEKLDVIGSIDNIAPGENLHSVRFNKNEGSIVTFMQIDPLFKLDLSDPHNPKISKGLKEEGVNEYLQYLSDDVLLGLGRGDEWGGTSGVKIAIYDNTGEDAVNVKTIYAGGYFAYSEAMYNPKAILNDTARNMFSFPINIEDYNGFRQGLMVFEYDINAENDDDKLIYRGLLSDLDGNGYESWDDYYYSSFSFIKRGARIGNKIYTISDRYITSYDLDTLKMTERLDVVSDPCLLMHKWGGWTGHYSTCTEDGHLTRQCQNNPAHTESITLKATGHAYGYMGHCYYCGKTGD